MASMISKISGQVINRLVKKPSIMRLGPLTMSPGVKTCAGKMSTSAFRNFSAVAQEDAATDTVPITFIYPNGEEVQAQAEIGKHMLDVAHDNNVDLEGGE